MKRLYLSSLLLLLSLVWVGSGYTQNTAFTSITIRELDATPGIKVFEQFAIDVSFENGNAQSVFSGFTDVSFDTTKVQIDSIQYATDFEFLQLGTIGDGVVSDVGAVSANLIPNNDVLIFTLLATALNSGSTTITLSEAAGQLAETTIYGNDGDQRGAIQYASSQFDINPIGDLLQNADFTNGLQNWGFFGSYEREWVNGSVEWYRNGWTEPVMFQVIEQPTNANQVIEAKARFTNLSNVPKTILMNIRNTDYSQQMICAVHLTAGESRYLTLRDVTDQAWPRIHYTIRTADRDSIPAIRVDDTSLTVGSDVAVSELSCNGDAPAVGSNYLLNGDFSYVGWRYWFRWGNVIADLANNALSIQIPDNSGPGVVATRVYQYFPNWTNLELSMDVTNNHGVTKGINALLREETWSQHTNCNFDIGAGATHRVTVRVLTNVAWGNSVVSLRPLQGDGLPLIVDDVRLRPAASGGANCSNTVIGSSTLALNAISPSPHISGEVTQFTLSGAPDDATIALDCDADGVFESDGLTCPVMSETVTAQVSTADGSVLGTTALTLEVMSIPETLAYLEAEFGLIDLDAIDLSDIQVAFDALFALLQQTDDPALASWLNRLAYAVRE